MQEEIDGVFAGGEDLAVRLRRWRGWVRGCCCRPRSRPR
ncbi:mutator family transposase domain protein [Mycobacterium xenopi 3993]|nr:mutator family transposase domain protein [Mycobacterium xenopi 3993]